MINRLKLLDLALSNSAFVVSIMISKTILVNELTVSFDVESTLPYWPLWRTTAALKSDDVSLLRLLFS